MIFPNISIYFFRVRVESVTKIHSEYVNYILLLAACNIPFPRVNFYMQILPDQNDILKRYFD